MLFFNQTFLKYLIAAVVGLALAGAAVPGFALHSRKIGVVNVDALNLRVGPGLSHDVMRVLEGDARVRILEDTGDWLQVMHNGEIGYVYDSRRYLKRYVVHTVKKGDNAELDVAQAKAKRIKRRIQNKNAEVSAFDRKAEKIADELESLDRQLVRMRKKRDTIEKELDQAAVKMKRIRQRVEKTEAAVAKQKDYADDRIVALYKLNRLGEMNLLATASSAYQMFRRKVAIETVVTHDETVITRMMDKKRRLAALLRQLESEKRQKRNLEENLRQTLDALAEKKQARKDVLAALKTKKSSRLATIRYLKVAAQRMEKTIATLQRSGPGSRKAFSEYQGLLKMPVEGKIVSEYGKYTEPQSGAVNFRNGIEIRSRRGSPVRAVFEGEIIFSDWVEGFGRVIIVSHGGSYYTVYAHLEDLFSQKGDRVESGEVIATVGDTGSIIGPALYFEVRHHGDPIDPLAWIDNG